MQKIKQWYLNLSLQQKIGRMIILSAIVPLIIFTIICALLFNNSTKRRSEKQIDENMTVVSERIVSYISSSVLCSNNLTINLNSLEADTSLRPFNKDNLILSNLNRSLLLYEGIDSIVYISKNGTMYSTSYDLYRNETFIKQSPYYEGLIDVKNGKTLLFDTDSSCMQRKDDVPVITFGKHVVEIGTGDTIGFLFINVTLSHLEATAQNEITQYVLYDSKGDCVTSNLDEKTEELLEGYTISNEEVTISKRKGRHSYLIANRSLGDNNWTLVGITDLSVYNISALQLLRSVTIAAIILFVLLILGNLALTTMLTRPLEQLVECAEEIKSGNLDVKFNFDSNDEIGKTGAALNTMTTEVSNLLERIEEESKRKRAYELALIQEQVKPHFLYNSLDIIIVLIEMNKSKEAARVTHKLANYYKNSLSSSAEFIPLEKEFQIIEDYLELQLIRYQDKFTYSTSLQENLRQVMVPKMTLQPLVENALYHGLKYKEEWGKITINAFSKENMLILVVEDDGIGMTGDTLVRAKSLSEKAEDHFGVYSVRHRLQLYYGENYNFDIQSAYYKGTTVTITIPLQGEKEC